MIETILNDVKSEIESIDTISQEYLVSQGTNNGFEKLVPIILEQVIEKYNSVYNITFEEHYGHHFPDLDIFIDDKKYGVEIKFRKNGTWTTNGNSVFESITNKNYENIYLLFGSKVPHRPQISVRYAPYWQATSSIKVTHSPRFSIDMDNLNNSVFETEEEYNTLRKMDEKSKVAFVQEYLAQNTDGAKWYTSDSYEIKAIPFNELPKETQNRILVEIMILYPDDLITGNRFTKYNNAAQYMIDEYYTFSKSLRDSFSASGKVKISGIEFPRIVQNYIENKSSIVSVLQESSNDFKQDAVNGWFNRQLISEEETNILSTYKQVLDNIAMEDEDLNSKIENLGFPNFSSFIFA